MFIHSFPEELPSIRDDPGILSRLSGLMPWGAYLDGRSFMREVQSISSHFS